MESRSINNSFFRKIKYRNDLQSVKINPKISIKKMVKDYQEIKRILLFILGLNWLVALIKIIVGIKIRSTSMAADGWHSFSDGASNIVGIIGITLASKKKDSTHPYGHKKYETFFALGIAFLLFLVALGIVHESIGRFKDKIVPQINLLSFLVMCVTMLINFLVMRFELKKGKQLQSDILISDSLHTRADIFTSLSVLCAFLAINFGFPALDPIVSILIALIISYSAFGIVKQSSVILCDSAAIGNLNEITKIVLEVGGVRSCHNIRTRGRPDDIYVDLHVEVSKDMTVEKAHAISSRIEKRIKEKLSGVSDVVVHIEPKD